MRHRTVALCALAATLSIAQTQAQSQLQVVFDASSLVPDVVLSKGVVLADLDADGVDDLVSAGNSTVGISLGIGDGTFGPTATITDATSPVLVEDVDGDGVLDIIHGMIPGQPMLAWSPGLGGGLVGPPQTLIATAAIQIPPTVFAGDIDGDAHLDLSVLRRLSVFGVDSIYVLRGGPLGTFSSALDMTIQPNTRLAFADLDGDGFDDVFYNFTFPSGLESYVWMRSLGDGTFAAPQGIGVQPGPLRGAFDLDGDGRDELLMTYKDAGEVIIEVFGLVGAPPLTLLQTVPDIPVFGNGTFSDAVLADHDGDSLDELAILWQQKVAFYDIAGDGTLVPQGHAHVCAGGVGQGSPGEEGVDIAASDLDGDGRVDLAVACNFGGTRIALNHTYFDAEPFQDLGQPLPGSNGIPTQLLDGDFGVGQTVEVRVLNAPVSEAAYWIAGVARLDTPFSGGVLVPSPDVIKGPFFSSPAGQLSLTANDLAAPPVDVYTQWWIVDTATAPGALAASTAVLLEAD